MYFSVYALDRAGAGDIRARNRDAHRARLKDHDHPVKVMMAGPLLADDGKTMIGSLLVFEAADKAAVEAFLAGDPYEISGLFERTEVRPFAWSIGAPAT